MKTDQVVKSLALHIAQTWGNYCPYRG